MTVVGVLTTHRKRVFDIRDTLESIVAQSGLDQVLLLPGDWFTYEAAEPIIDGLGVQMQVVEDIGPGTKHLAGVVLEPGEHVIVTFDDDVIYAPGHVSTLLAALEGSSSPVGFNGFRATKPIIERVRDGGDCNFLNGETSWAYPLSWLDTEAVLQFGRQACCRWHDDPYIGYIFHQSGRCCHVLEGAAPEYRFPTRATRARGVEALNQSPGRHLRLRSSLDHTFWSVG
jgi:hypothetical protein